MSANRSCTRAGSPRRPLSIRATSQMAARWGRSCRAAAGEPSPDLEGAGRRRRAGVGERPQQARDLLARRPPQDRDDVGGEVAAEDLRRLRRVGRAAGVEEQAGVVGLGRGLPVDARAARPAAWWRCVAWRPCSNGKPMPRSVARQSAAITSATRTDVARAAGGSSRRAGRAGPVHVALPARRGRGERAVRVGLGQRAEQAHVVAVVVEVGEVAAPGPAGREQAVVAPGARVVVGQVALERRGAAVGEVARQRDGRRRDAATPARRGRARRPRPAG